MDERAQWWCGMLIALMAGLYLGLMIPQTPPAPAEAAPAFAAAEPQPEENLFAQPATGFAIEVVRVDKPEPKRVLIYHTHTYEAFAQNADDPYAETETWRTADSGHNMIRVGEELAALLRALGLEVVHDTTAFEPPALSSAYSRSLSMLEKRLAAGESYDLYIDLHRDAYSASYGGGNTVAAPGGHAAKLMMLIGRGEGAAGGGYAQKPDWQANLAIAQSITDSLNQQQPGLCREVCVKSGRYNQHIAPCCILVEAGNNRNTLQEVLAAMPYLADAVNEVLAGER